MTGWKEGLTGCANFMRNVHENTWDTLLEHGTGLDG
jgi:hypothetical protein